MESLDLNIDNYSISNLKTFFGFTDLDIPLTNAKLVETKHSYETIINSTQDFSKEYKSKLYLFISTAIDRLSSTIPTENLATSSIAQEEQKIIHAKVPFDQTADGHMIVTKPPSPFIYTNPSEAFTGQVNPLERRIIVKQICFDTLFRDNYETTGSEEIMFQLKEPLNNIISMQLTAFELPRMWYTFSKQLNNVTMKINLYNLSSIAEVKETITLPDGNYNSEDFASTINNIFNDNPYLNILLCSVDSITGKTVITVNPTASNSPYNSSGTAYSPTFYYELIFVDDTQDIRTAMGWYMGFRKRMYIVTKSDAFISYTYSSSSTTSFEGYIQSEACFTSNLENYLYLDVNDFNNNYNVNTVVAQSSFSSFICQSVLGRITLNTVPFTIVNDTKADMIYKTREYFGPVRIHKLMVRLLNKFGQPVKMLQNDYSFVLEFKQLYS
jgi:hypothetical protein